MENLKPRVKQALATLASQIDRLPKAHPNRKRKLRLHKRLALLLGRLDTPNAHIRTQTHKQALKLLGRVEPAPRRKRKASMPAMQLNTAHLGAQMHRVFATTLRKRSVTTAEGKARAAFSAAMMCDLNAQHTALLHKWQQNPVGSPPARPTHWHGLTVKEWQIWATRLARQFAKTYTNLAQGNTLLERPDVTSVLHLTLKIGTDEIKATNRFGTTATLVVAAPLEGDARLYVEHAA